MTATPSLAAFLLARIEEDETVARAATPGLWESDGYRRSAVILSAVTAPEVPTDDGTLVAVAMDLLGCDAVHIARHDPARVLAECTAKRAIVGALGQFAGKTIAACDTVVEHVYSDAAEFSLRHLAAVYAGHSEFRLEWRP